MHKIIIFSGAGLSAESGISTFRDSDGLWENHKIEEICDFRTWKKNKEKVFDFYNQRRLQLNEVKPSAGHTLIKKLQDEFGVENIINITQNVDDLLERAGVENVLHVHGKLNQMMCLTCNYKWDVKYSAISAKDAECPECASQNVKPDVVFFGEAAPNYMEMYHILQTMDRSDIIIVIGTLGNVVPIELIIKSSKAHKILNNLEKSVYINDKIFNLVLYGKISDKAEEIFEYVKLKREGLING